MRKISLMLAIVMVQAATVLAAPKPAVADRYLDLTVTYSIHAKSMWHDVKPPDVGGYWGDGLAPTPDKNGNGNIRGMCNTMLGYALLVHAMDNGWLDPHLASLLQQAGLSRSELLRYITLNLRFLNAHHHSSTSGLKPQWGKTWQSTLWLGSSGPAVLLVWKDLPEDVKHDFARVAAMEADRVVTKPPKDYKPGDTGAEENAWDEFAPAVALAVDPHNPHAADWMKAIKTYAANVYSTRADKGQEFVSTANLFDDFTLENHGFFHPDYLQGSGASLGETLVILEMGDKIQGTKFAPEFKPFAMHHLADVWQKVMRPLLADHGEFVFPNGTDWTIHCGMTPSYLATIATLLDDPLAIADEPKQIESAFRRRDVSPPGRILGDTNLEWWWEPLLISRSAMALLQHKYRDPSEGVATSAWEDGDFVWPDAKVFACVTPDYFASAAYGERHMGTFYPTLRGTEYLTVPIDGILPNDVNQLVRHVELGDAHVAVLRCKSGAMIDVVCLPHSVLWISSAPLRALGIENDKLSGGKRQVAGNPFDKTINMLANTSTTISGRWLNIDGKLGLIAVGDGFSYTSPKAFNRKSAAFDAVTPVASWGAWQMIPGATREQTEKSASTFAADRVNQHAKITVDDGEATFHIETDLDKDEISVQRAQ